MNPRRRVLAYLACVYFRGYQAIFVFHCLAIGISLSDTVVLAFITGIAQAVGSPIVKWLLQRFAKNSARRYVGVLQAGAVVLAVGYVQMANASSVLTVVFALAVTGLAYACIFGPYYELVRRSVESAEQRAIVMATLSLDIWLAYAICSCLSMLLGGVVYGVFAISPATVLYAQACILIGAVAVIAPLGNMVMCTNEPSGVLPDSERGVEYHKWIGVLNTACNTAAFNLFLPIVLELKLNHVVSTALAMPCYMIVTSVGIAMLRRSSIVINWSIIVPCCTMVVGILVCLVAQGGLKLIGLGIIAFSDYCSTAIVSANVGKRSAKSNGMHDVISRNAAMNVVTSILCRRSLSAGALPSQTLVQVVSGYTALAGCIIAGYSVRWWVRAHK